MEKNLRWPTYTLTVAFATYWLVNLLLWYPWSYNATLGMTLMFVAITPFWIYAVYHCIIRFNGKNILHGALYTSLIFSFVAIVLDYIFYGVIRNAMNELYHPTTFYGYGFLLALPFIEVFLFNKKLKQKIRIKNNEFLVFGVLGLASLLGIIVIVTNNITLSASTFKFITMIFASLAVFNLVIWIILRTREYRMMFKRIAMLSIICVIFGMLIGKYGENLGLNWWTYYPVPVIMNLTLPPIVLRMNKKQTIYYLILATLSAPFIHTVFSFFFNWSEYMPFLNNL